VRLEIDIANNERRWMNMDRYTLKRICLALAVGATLFQTSSCTTTDVLSLIGLSALLGVFSTST
jgi:hypothetical protein